MNAENLIPAQKGEVRNPKGRGKGTKNRSTVIREILEAINSDTGKTYEYDVNYQQVVKALQGDTLAYKAIMDSSYGAPKQEIESKTEQSFVIDWGISETDSTGEPTQGATGSNTESETV